MSKKYIDGSEEDENTGGRVELEFPSTTGTRQNKNKRPRAPKQNPAPIEGLHEGEATSGSTAVTQSKYFRPKTYKTADVTSLPAPEHHGRPITFDGVLMDSPQRPRPPTIAPGSPPSPREPRSVDRDSEAAEVAKGLQDTRAEDGHAYGGEGSDEDEFPDGHFEEPPDSEDERLRLLGVGQAGTLAEPGEISSTYSRALGEALRELRPEPAGDHSRAPSPASEATNDSFGQSTSSEEYMSGLNDALSKETDARRRARLEHERDAMLKTKEEKARQYAEEQAQWRRATKGKGKEMGEDDDGEIPKPVVTKLTKAQMERVKQLAEDERERFGLLAREMRVPVELILEVAHRQTAKSRGGPWNDWLRLYSAEHPDHGKLSTPRLLHCTMTNHCY